MISGNSKRVSNNPLFNLNGKLVKFEKTENFNQAIYFSANKENLQNKLGDHVHLLDNLDGFEHSGINCI